MLLLMLNVMLFISWCENRNQGKLTWNQQNLVYTVTLSLHKIFMPSNFLYDVLLFIK